MYLNQVCVWLCYYLQNTSLLLKDQNPEEVSENLLIDWNDDQSQQRTDNTENLKEFEDWKPKTSQWITFDESEVARMNDQFERFDVVFS